MLGKYKQLCIEQQSKIKELQKELRVSKRTLNDLEHFIEWMNQKSEKERARFFGLKKFSVNKCMEYVGFMLVTSDNSENSEDKHRKYCIIGYLCNGQKEPPKVYKAALSVDFSEDVKNLKKTIRLEENVVIDETRRGFGIGSAGIEAVKDFASQAHCSEILGLRRYCGKYEDDDDLEEKNKKLFRYYEKNGFQQHKDHISFDMSNYKKKDMIVI